MKLTGRVEIPPSSMPTVNPKVQLKQHHLLIYKPLLWMTIRFFFFFLITRKCISNFQVSPSILLRQGNKERRKKEDSTISSSYKSLRESYLSLKVNNNKGKKYMIQFGFMLGYIGQSTVQRVMTAMGGGLKRS